MTYGVTHLTRDSMIIQAGANPLSDEEKSWTGKGINAVRLAIESAPLWGIQWLAMVHGDKIICSPK